MLVPGCAWLLVSPGHFFFHCNATYGLKGTVHSKTFIKLPIERLKMQKKFQGRFDSENGFVSHFINYGSVSFDTDYTPLNLKKESF